MNRRIAILIVAVATMAAMAGLGGCGGGGTTQAKTFKVTVTGN